MRRHKSQTINGVSILHSIWSCPCNSMEEAMPNNAYSKMLQMISDIDKERKLKVYLHYINGTERDLIDWVNAYEENVSNYP